MIRDPDLTLTIVVLAPCLVLSVGALVAWWIHRPVPVTRRRLTSAEVRRLCGVTPERAQRWQWN